jgi:signal transduction histidine kinase
VNALAVARPSRRLPWTARDALLAGFVALLCQLDLWFPLPFVTRESHRVVLGVVFLASSLALTLRRRAPVAVLAFVYGVGSLMYLAIGAPEALGTFLPPLVALYAVGRYADIRALPLAAAIALIGTAVHELEDPNFELSGPAIFFWAMVAAAWPLGRAFRVREEAVRSLSRRAADLELSRDAEASAARAAERARIARELHDIVGHGVSVIVLQLVAASGMLDKGDDQAVRTRLAATERSARETLAEMRRLLELLGEDETAALAPQPTLADLERLVEQARDAGVPVEFVVRGDRRELAAGLELTIYRVAQEALTNVIKHARPASARVCLTYTPDEVRIQVRDDGRTPAEVSVGSRGIAGMRERVALYAGELTVGPRAEGGFQVDARFPVGDA